MLGGDTDDSVGRQENIKMPLSQRERHRTGHVGWPRAAVLGAHDGILSTASLVLGVAAAHGPPGGILVSGVAGLVAGAMSIAAGEYVSVRSQADTEQADLKLERAELIADNRGEHQELAAIYVTASIPHSRNKSPISSCPMTLSAHMPVTSSAYPRLSGLVRFRLH
jgi:hypothetical protein